jgi:hypothetical protein
VVEPRQEEGERILKELDAASDEMEESPGRNKNVVADGLINGNREFAPSSRKRNSSAIRSSFRPG